MCAMNNILITCVWEAKAIGLLPTIGGYNVRLNSGMKKINP